MLSLAKLAAGLAADGEKTVDKSFKYNKMRRV